MLLLDVLAQDGDGCATDRAGEVRPGPQPFGPPVVPLQSRELLRNLREDTPLRLLTSREIATVGGTFTSRWT